VPKISMTSIDGRAICVDRTAKVAAPQRNSAERTRGSQAKSTFALWREEFRANDPATARHFFETAYQPGWQVTGLKAGSEVLHRRSETSLMILDEICLPGQVNCTVQPGDRVVVIQPRVGTVRCAGDDERQREDDPVLFARGLDSVLHLSDAAFAVISIDTSVLRAVAAEVPVPLPAEIRFLEARPRSAATTRAWQRTVDYVSATLTSPDAARQPLIVAAAARTVAAALLECFSSTFDRRAGGQPEPTVPASLDRAIAFIHRMAMDNIGIDDIAESVNLTPRAVQYLFRRQLDTTPTEYLRQVRMHRAHQDLIAGDRTVTTVAAIAAKWGFAHTGRFAVLYRQTYGQSPHTTLRD
jgi:AraC-like DNA-binding protein